MGVDFEVVGGNEKEFFSPMVFLGFCMKKKIFEGFNPALEKKEGEKDLKARLG